MTFEVAKRESVPLLISIAGTSGSGKTYSALLLAAGLAGENGKVGLIDTELGRGSMYADDPDITNNLPGNQYYVSKMTEPFTPEKYLEAVNQAIKAGITVLIIDSFSHEWEGFGGCCDIAENNKLRGMPNWATAKLRHKRLMNSLTQCPIHIIFCLRAREKTKPIKNEQTGSVEMVDMGLQPIQEKNFIFEMTLSMMLSEEAPGNPILTKCPKPLLSVFNKADTLVSCDQGVKLTAWADKGEAVDLELRHLKRECREAAMFGNDSLDEFFKNLNKDDKTLLVKNVDKYFQEEVRALAEEADRIRNEEEPQQTETPAKLTTLIQQEPLKTKTLTERIEKRE